MNDTGIKYRELYRKPASWIIPFVLGGIYIYGGSGAWCKHYNTGEKYIKIFSKRFKTIVLPSTYDKTFEYPKVEFYCRDMQESQSNMPSATFCHDLAFYLTPQPKNKATKDVGHFFRRDAERNQLHALPKDNWDISRDGKQLNDAYEFIEHINSFKTIYTDRLHVAIAGTLIGKEVHIFSNNYFKTRAIFESSMRNNFKNCTFHSEPFKE